MSRYKHFLPCTFCSVLLARLLNDSTIKLEKVEYIDGKTFKVAVFMPDVSVSYKISDETLSVYSVKNDLYYRISNTEELSDTEYRCALRRELKSEDKVMTTSLGSFSERIYLDVQTGEQQ
jgi:hypothetical protein